MIRRARNTGLSRVVIGSAIVHVLAVGSVAVLAGTGKAMREAPKAVEVKLTRLGKKRPDDYLPRKESAPPPPKKAAPVPVTEKPEPQKKPQTKAPEKKTDPKDRLQNLNRLSNALDRLKKMDEPEGSEEGSEFGNTSEIVDATERARFGAEVQGCLQQNFILEGLSQQEVRNKVAHIIVSVSASGEVKFMEMRKSTGNERLDRQVQNAARRCKKVGPAPESIGNSWSSGILVKFRPDA